jgi:methionyl-tRNA formyltransferase
MKLVFAGTPEFAAVSLEALLAARHEVTLVLTQPDRPAGRGLKPQVSPVKRLALEHGLRVYQPTTLKDPAAIETIRALHPEVMAVAAYGQLLPPAALALPPRGCVNVHASLLPRWRGAAPIHRALLAGDAETGVTIMQMDEGLDTGAMLIRRAIPIAPEDTTGTLHDKLAALGAQLLVEALASNPVPREQDAAAATYAPRIRKQDAEINWRRPAAEIERQVRAFDPAPGAHTTLDNEGIKIWRASLAGGAGGVPGMVREADSEGIVVACGQDALRISELQRAGGRRLPVSAFLSGHKLAPGVRFGSAHD